MSRAKGSIEWHILDRKDQEPVVEARVVAGGVIKYSIPYTLEELKDEFTELGEAIEAFKAKTLEQREAAKPKTPKPAPPVDPQGIPEKPLAPKSEANQVLSALEGAAAKGDEPPQDEPPKA